MLNALETSKTETRLRLQLTMPGMFLRLEGLAVFIASIALYSRVSGDWLAFVVLLLTPDISIAGYLLNPRAGSLIYNIVHFYGLPVTLGMIALFGGWSAGVALALIWTAHISMDRAVGYGFKYTSGFKSTHLGRV